MPPASALLEPLRQLPLLTAEQRVEAERLIAELWTARAVAAELVARGWLTEYQGGEVTAGRIDSLVVGNYVRLEKLGGGGMGEVFRARHATTGQEVALKVMKEDLSDSPELVERFRREGEAAVQLRHENVVRVHEHGTAGDDVHYLVMELLRGVNLRQYLRQRTHLEPREAVECVRQACVGMQYVHEQGLIHRDLKPSNLLRTEEGLVKVLDLGMVKVKRLGALTRPGAFLGTTPYAAPEHVTDASGVDVRADVYSLGCTLYELLTGRTPYLYARSTSDSEPPQIESLVPGFPPAVAAIVRKMMAKRREDRHQTPGEAAAELGAWLRGQEPEALATEG